MKENISKILEYLGEDLQRAGLEKTPEQAAKTLKFLTQGYSQSFDEISKDSTSNCDVATITDIKELGIYSLCEEHMLPFIGKCRIQYLPKKKLIQAEKLQSIIDFHACRLQNQQNLTEEIANSIKQLTDAEWLEVTINAKHLCLMIDGAEKIDAEKVTVVRIED